MKPIDALYAGLFVIGFVLLVLFLATLSVLFYTWLTKILIRKLPQRVVKKLELVQVLKSLEGMIRKT